MERIDTEPKALTVTKLTHQIGFTTILKEINFTLREGEVLSIIGPSGGGKTTLLRLCAGLLDVEEGELTNTFTKTSIAFQDARLLPWKNLIDNIALGLIATGVFKKQSREKAKQMAKSFGLEENDFEKYPKNLSGGMKQRASFARALVVQPQLLFLDEPFSALDIGLKRSLQLKLIERIENTRLTVLFITHDLKEAIRLSDQIILLDANGEIVKSFTLSKSRRDRDEKFLYETTTMLMNDAVLLHTFELS